MKQIKDMRGFLFLWIWCTTVCSVLEGQNNNYVVSWLGIPVVDITVTIEPGDTVIQGIYTAKTRKWFDPIYSVDNRYNITCDASNYYPLKYAKQIIEKGNKSSFSSDYKVGDGLTDYSNGLQRTFPVGYYNLLSSLLWVERRNWLEGERHDIRIEIEGTLWHVALHCRKISKEAAGSKAEIEALFVAQVAGEPVLSHTDIVTHRLPVVGNKMVFFMQLEHKLVEAIEFGRPPFLVRATLVSS
jgi:hypothetical protein